MRGDNNSQGAMFSYIDLEARVRPTHPIYKIRRVVDKAVKAIGPDFDELYSEFGRASIALEKLLSAQLLLLQILYSIRSERQLVERIDYAGLWAWLSTSRSGITRHSPRIETGF